MNKYWAGKVVCYTLALTFLFSIFAIIYYIFAFSEGKVHSDIAAKVLFAHEQHIMHQYFPEGYCYSTGVFVFGIETLISGLMFFIKDWMLCREVAQFLQVVLLFLSLFLFLRNTFGKKRACIGCLVGVPLFILPLSDIVYNLYYFEAAYTKNAIFLLLIFAITGKIFVTNEKKKGMFGLFYLRLLI